jgi:hypothetical protein
MIDPGDLRQPGSFFNIGHSEALGINNAGVVVGTARNSLGLLRPFLYDSQGTLYDLASIVVGLLSDDFVIVNGINDQGQVIGTVGRSGPDGFLHAYLFNPVNGTGPGNGVPEPGGLGLVAAGFVRGGVGPGGGVQAARLMAPGGLLLQPLPQSAAPLMNSESYSEVIGSEWASE